MLADKVRQQPQLMLLMMALVMPLAFPVWNAQHNNFVVEFASFSGRAMAVS